MASSSSTGGGSSDSTKRLQELRDRYEESLRECEASHPNVTNDTNAITGEKKTVSSSTTVGGQHRSSIQTEAQRRSVAVERIQLHWRRFLKEQQRIDTEQELEEDEAELQRVSGQSPTVRPSASVPNCEAEDGDDVVEESAAAIAARRIQHTWKVRYLGRVRKVAAAQRIQRLWRNYRDAVETYDDTASTAGSCPADIAEAAERIQQTWRRYRTAVSTGGGAGARGASSPGGREEEEEEEQEMAVEMNRVLAAGRIQTLWRRYRTAVVAASMVNSIEPSPGIQASAANRIQEAWRRYQSARDGEEVDGRPSPDAGESGLGNTHSSLPLRAHSVDSLISGGNLGVDEVEQEEALLQLEDELETLSHMMDNTGVEALNLTTEDGRTTGTAHSTEGPPEDEEEVVSLASQMILAAEDGVVGVEPAAPEHVSPVSGRRARAGQAASAIQTFWRGRRVTRTTTTDGPTAAASADMDGPSQQADGSPVQAELQQDADRNTGRGSRRFTPEGVDALMILQRRFRFNRLLNMVVERERNDAARRLQDEWRRRQAIRCHRRQMEQGRQDAAASCIQRFSRLVSRRRQRLEDMEALHRGQVPCSPGFRTSGTQTSGTPLGSPVSPEAPKTQQVVGAARASPPTESPTTAGGGGGTTPCCIICLDTEVQMALMPCGHAQFCAECASRLRRCPNCRQTVAMRIRIFL